MEELIGILAAAAAVDAVAHNERQIMRLRRRRIRDSMNPFDIPASRFIELYRLPQEFVVTTLIPPLLEALPPAQRQSAISWPIRIMSTLNFMARGSYQRAVGQDFLSCMSQTMVSRSIAVIAPLITEVFGPQWVRFPTTVEEIQAAKAGFMESCELPGVVAAVDGTQIEIQPQSYDDEHAPEVVFVNKDGRHALNAQVVCDKYMKLLAVNPRYPGSNHDAFNWRASSVRRHMQREWRLGRRNKWILGDSAYPQEPWLMKPFPNPIPGSREELYNRRHKRGRCVVERTIGLWKSWQRCINRCRTLQYSPQAAGNIITASAVLHNMSLHTRVPMPPEAEWQLEPHIVEEAEEEVPLPQGLAIVQAGNEARRRLVQIM